jgi:L,D-peptidoglycan transpeptidase YkuD (ErfK/YbiS/YcfS/YnhG family)
MRSLFLCLFVLLAPALFCSAQQLRTHASVKTKDALARSRQLVVVTTNDWDTLQGTLRRFERRSARAKWHSIGPTVAVVVGRNGLGWGAGLNAESGDGPVKKEGDGKAPAGIFRLSSAFGYAPASDARWLRVPYLPLTETIECVDDVNSSKYNLILDRRGVASPDWQSSEKMRSAGEAYRWGVVVEHNTAPTVAGRGSCIFLHIWGGPDKGTAGCTAMQQPALEVLMRWLDPRRRPALVQLPSAEYERLKARWGLPEFTE